MSNDIESGGGEGSDAGLPSVNPDIVEQELGAEIDNIVPSHGYDALQVVALGGSAGSIPALQDFLRTMPPDSGLAFVIILHLAPEFDSRLPGLLERRTSMRVLAAENGQVMEPNHVYVIPPGKFLSSDDGKLCLTDLVPERGRRVTIDLFLRTLADTHGAHAAAIIFSGVDGDGSIGIKRIKERGGLTIAQDPAEAEHADMPRAAIGTGMVDWVLRTQEMPQRLLDYFNREKQLKLPPEEGPQPAKPAVPSTSDRETALRDVLSYLQTRTGRDFSYYKRATILRRIARRMQVNGLDELRDYLSFLRTHPGEAGALLQDLLISVTNFFRDRDSFKKLESKIPDLFKGKTAGDTVRVWVPACATGEEAYSIAMLLAEESVRRDAPPSIQIFATDLGEDAIRMARHGVYSPAITADVSEERLRRFFVREADGYRIRRELRETVLFALHDVLKDSPFSKVDLISCRNLLIYLNREAQKQIFELFNFSLRPDGILFLGSSETIDDASGLFRVVDKKARIYNVGNQVRRLGFPSLQGFIAPTFLKISKRSREHPVVPKAPQNPTIELVPATMTEGGSRAVSWAEVHYRALEFLGPPSLIVNSDYDILHLSEGAAKFLQFVGGMPSANLLNAVHPMLRIELRAALFRAVETKGPSEAYDVPLDLDGHASLVTIRVSPVNQVASDLLVVVFERRDSAQRPPRAQVGPHSPEIVTGPLERELQGMKSHLRDVVEQYEASTEELKAGNEELQAMNEELHSATEELETSREELESVNEELVTVNQEMKSTVEDLAHANSDLNNLMGSTAIATIFLNRELGITRFTPTAVELFKLIPTDVGRPLTDLTHELDYPDLASDASQVLARLIPVEREVAQLGGRWFVARLLPYRTTDDHIGGVVLTFVDITERKAAEKALLEAKAKLEAANESLEQNIQERTAKLTEALGELEAFSYTIAHDMRAPLRAMQGFAALIMEEQSSKLDTSGMNYLSRIRTASSRLDRLIQDVLNYSCVARQNWPLEEVDLSTLLPELVSLYPHLQEPAVEIRFETPLPTVMGHPATITQVFANLFDNAAKFTVSGAKPVINVRAELEESTARFWIIDNGIGIPPEAREKIFRMFERLDRSPLIEGVGIGLAIVRKGMERMGGKVGVESLPGQGSRFWLEFRLAAKP